MTAILLAINGSEKSPVYMAASKTNGALLGGNQNGFRGGGNAGLYRKSMSMAGIETASRG